MRKLVAALFILGTLTAQAQKNVFLEQSFWKENPSVETVKAAIAQGNDPHAFNPSSFDGITLAINNGAPNETVKYLLELPGSSVNRVTHDSRIYLHWAGSKGNVELVEYLLAKGANLDHEDSRGTLPVAYAANGGQVNPALYEAFFKAGVDPKKKIQRS
ncbi:MAG: ankyrin repeat domain-containing protein [Chitinophagaceae bacterium]|nr:ankyrin repeat domain-containing protein [Chitinophagaceae bacterium]